MDRPILPLDAKKILEKLNENGFEAYIVGGCVRDSIMGIEPFDWDIATSAKPQEVKALFPHTYDTGIDHGTVTVLINRRGYEVTTYRVEGKYEDFRRPKEVFFTGSLKEDLLRRDFTMNAIAYHPQIGYVDPFEGRADIQRKIIRGVGNPYERFGEDALRMLRAVRFSAKLGFEIEEQTWNALVQTGALIEKISAERIREELLKLLTSRYVEKISLLWETGLLSHISKELNGILPKRKQELISQLKNAPSQKEPRLVILLQYLTLEEAKQFLHQMKFDTKTMKTILTVLEQLSFPPALEEYQIRRQVFAMGVSPFEILLQVKLAAGEKEFENTKALFLGIQKRGDCIFTKDLCLNGGDLIKEGVLKGPEVGKLLGLLLDYVHKNPENNEKGILLRQLRCILGKK